MPRSLHLLLAFALASLGFCSPGYAQDAPAPAVGDVAKQAQKGRDKDKGKPAAKRVFTNDDFPSGSGAGTPSTSPGLAQPGQSGAQVAGQLGAPGELGASAAASLSSSPSTLPTDQLDQMAALLDQIGSLDRATLAKNVLQGDDTDFPGRGAWEEKLFAAKQLFVAHERDIISKATQLDASSIGGLDAQNPNDPHAKDLDNQLDQLVQETEQSSAAFQALANQGKELAGQSLSH